MSASGRAGNKDIQNRGGVLAPPASAASAPQVRVELITDEGLEAVPVCPKLCGGELRQVDSSRWGRYWRCRNCGHECRDASWRPDSLK
jgi:hypothetical protein